MFIYYFPTIANIKRKKNSKQNNSDYVKNQNLLENQIIDEVAPEERINESENYENTPVDDEQLRD